ncbi:uncharacterized protein N7484_001377 [Penicillium longicatenatum]|uniref:uncharacterized protein n=1 Tax=Penicillium longicatenatum TaxID=1561947 RepID=UPI0025483F38|nr:uncharacterized protein N7484_001377 [Penicillium longicatenatum]KAJ5657728.1 hypothetical protein N7484_001377 [Penicillium longicatenatum]
MANPRINWSRYLVRQNEHDLETLLHQGTFKPLLLYHVVFFNCLPWVGLVIPKSRGGRYFRPLIFALSLAFAIEVLMNQRALLGGNGYMIGMMVGWWLVWSATLFVFSDVERDYQRIERVTISDTRSSDSKRLDAQSESIGDNNSPLPAEGATDQQAHFRWQSYPSRLSHRIEWCAGLLFNLRGPEWNWRAPRLGRLPRTVHANLHSGFLASNLREEDEVHISAKTCLSKAFRTFLISYLTLDAFKVILIRDPYFRGMKADTVPPFPFSFLASIPLGIRFYHCFLSAMAVYVALTYVTSLNPICFLGLSMAFPNASRKLTAAPLDKSWLYADTFGPFISPVLDDGLAGVWGTWWHQLFRHGFTSTARWILSLLPGSWAIDPRVKRVIYIVVAFSLSGFVHACGSYTQFTDTRPLSGPFLFFFLQSMAILIEHIFKVLVISKLPLGRIPRWLRRTANGLVVFFWFLFSGPFIADDFARGGLWLMEPVPISPLRGLELANGQGWWCWEGDWFKYWNDGTYWGSGIRVN